MIFTTLLSTGCSTVSDELMDPALIDIAFSTDPAEVVADQPVKLKAVLSGTTDRPELQFDFEIRKAGDKTALGKYVEGENTAELTFMAEETFEESGAYDIYLHIYDFESHITKKKELQVQ